MAELIFLFLSWICASLYATSLGQVYYISHSRMVFAFSFVPIESFKIWWELLENLYQNFVCKWRCYWYHLELQLGLFCYYFSSIYNFFKGMALVILLFAVLIYVLHLILLRRCILCMHLKTCFCSFCGIYKIALHL